MVINPNSHSQSVSQPCIYSMHARRNATPKPFPRLADAIVRPTRAPGADQASRMRCWVSCGPTASVYPSAALLVYPASRPARRCSSATRRLFFFSFLNGRACMHPCGQRDQRTAQQAHGRGVRRKRGLQLWLAELLRDPMRVVGRG